MARIIIKKFGPISSFVGNFSGFNVLIGPQASGKSTITKLVYFFKMIPTWIASFEPPYVENRTLYGELVKIFRHKFLNLFGPVSHNYNMKITYYYSIDNTEDYYCIISNKDNLVRFDFSKNLKDMIFDMLDLVKTNYNVWRSSGESFSGITKIREQKDFFSYKNLLDAVRERFNNEQTPIFIPAGRTLLTLLSGQVSKIPHDERDFIMGDFLETIQKIRPQFQNSLEELEGHAASTQKIPPDPERAKLAREMIYKVLRGKYTYEGGEERIYHSQREYTKLSYASSGQQEAVWILLMAYILILERVNTFIVFEEPEAHLYPEGQDAVMRLLALLYGSAQNNQIIVTTHSPYVLSSINNLLYAEKVGRKNKAAAEIINKKMWLPCSGVTAYCVEGSGHDIMNRELAMIKAEEIDRASSLLNHEFERILDYDS